MENLRIANMILQLVKSETTFTDMQLKPSAKMSYRSPRGMVKSVEDLTQQDIEAFAAFADKDWKERIVTGQGQFDVAFNISEKVRLRCDFYYSGGNNSLSVAIRTLHAKIPKLEDLGVDPKLRELLFSNVSGLILIAGPTSAGKTTTQFSLLDNLNNTAPFHIVTFEQPIEYNLIGNMSEITQREVPKDVASFEIGVKSVKRLDPDVIMIGELLSPETVGAMLDIANTGHFVIAGTHAQSAEDAIDTLLKYYTGPELQLKRAQLATSLLAVSSQRLLPSRDGKSNVMVYDLLVNTPVIAKAIRDGNIAGIPALLNGDKGNSVRLNDVLAEKVNKNQIELKDAWKATKDTESLSKLLGGQRPSL